MGSHLIRKIAGIVVALAITGAALVYLQAREAERANERTAQQQAASALADDIAAHQQANPKAPAKIGSATVPADVNGVPVQSVSKRQLAGDDTYDRTDHFGYLATGTSATLVSVSFDSKTETATAAQRTAGQRRSTHTWHVCRFDIAGGKVTSTPCTTQSDEVVAKRGR